MTLVAAPDPDFPRFTPETLLAYLNETGITHQIHHHPAVFTVAESKFVDADIPGSHTRNHFLKDKKDNMFLVTLLHDTPVDLKKLSDYLNAGRFSFGSPERLWSYLGVTPGSVTPLSILNDVESRVTLILEEGMMAEDVINVHPLINTMTVGIPPSSLMKLLKDFGVMPRILDLSPVAPD